MRAYFDRMLAWLGSSTADPLLAVGDQQVLRVRRWRRGRDPAQHHPRPPGPDREARGPAQAELDLAEPEVKALFDWINGHPRRWPGNPEKLKLPGVAIFSAQAIVIEQLRAPLMRLFELFNQHLNPNEMWSQATHDEGLFTIPLAVVDGKRSGVREHLLADGARPGLRPLPRDPDAGVGLPRPVPGECRGRRRILPGGEPLSGRPQPEGPAGGRLGDLGLRPSRGHPGRGHVQHATVADALGDRAEVPARSALRSPASSPSKGSAPTCTTVTRWA